MTHDLFAALYHPSRLAALRQLALLDQSSVPALDRLARLAARLLQAPTVLVSLVEPERQFFASGVGLREPWGSARETPLSHSFCQHVVASAAPLVINNAREHPLVHTNLALPDLGVVAYAGVPLVTSDGYAIGSFCAIDNQPRNWTSDELDTLCELATCIMTEIELRCALVFREHSEQAVKARFRRVADLMGQGLVMTDPQGQVLYANPHFHALIAASPGATLETPINDVVGRNQLWPDAAFWQHRGLESTLPYTTQITRYDHKTRWVEICFSPLQADTGELVGTIALVTDIDDRVRTEMALRESEAKLRLLFDQLPGILWTTSTDLRITSFHGNGKFQALGLMRNGAALAEVFGANDLHSAPITAHQSALQGRSGQYEYRDGEYIFAVQVEPLLDSQNQIVGCLGLAQDVTQRTLLAEQLEQGRVRLHALSSQLIQAQEVERRTIARELHDEIGQSLTAAQLNLQVLLLDADAVLVSRLEDSISLVEQVLGQVRDLSLDLRPSLLDDLGLEAALSWYVQRQAQRSGLVAHVDVVPIVPRPPIDVETTCFRIVQEAVTNVVRYARASSVRVTLHWADSVIELLVDDDGVGFDVAAARRRAVHGGSLGLLGMQERALLLGGELMIRSAPGQGTTVRALLPLRYEGDAFNASEERDS